MKGFLMSRKKFKRKNICSLYDKLYKAYYLHSVLNKILLGLNNFEKIEINTLSIVCNSYLYNARKQALDMIPLKK